MIVYKYFYKDNYYNNIFFMTMLILKISSVVLVKNTNYIYNTLIIS